MKIRWSFMRGPCAAHLACAFSKRASVYAGHVCSGEHLYVGDSFLSFVFLSACRDRLCGSGSAFRHSPKFIGVKECSDNYKLVYLKLGAKAGAPTFPDVGFKSPKGAVGLGDSALDFFVDVGLTVQGASQKSQFIHIIDHLLPRYLVRIFGFLIRKLSFFGFSFEVET